MRRKQIAFSDKLYDYMLQVGAREHKVLKALRKRTDRMTAAGMQIGPHQGALMALLAQAIGARRTLEVGVFTGYSALAVALALPPDGKVVACDVSEEYTAIARRYWRMAGVAAKIELHIAPALKTLKRLIGDGASGTFDFAFIDADKELYDAYYEAALALLRRGGLVAIDNVLWGGSVVDAQRRNGSTRAIRALNRKIARDKRVSICLVPVGDGLTLALKR